MRKNVFLACALTLAAVSAPAFAGDAQGQQGFIRGEIGRADVKIDDLGSDKDTAYGIGGGYWFSANWGIEGAYNRLYDENLEGGYFKLHSFTVGGVAKKNFGADGNGFFIGGRTGYAHSTAKERYEDEYFSARSSQSTGGWYAGANVGYDFNRNFGLGLNYTYTRAFSNVDVSELTLSGEYRF